MLAIVLFCLGVGAVAFLVGSLLMVVCGATPPVRHADRATAATWLGVAGCAGLLLVIAFFAALDPLIVAIAAIVAALLALASANVRASAASVVRAIRIRHILVAGALAAGVALFASVAPTFYDTAMYQYSASQWLGAFGVVRGLALFQHRLGTISPWYALVSPFESGVLRGRMIGAPMAIALWLSLFPVAIAATRWLTGEDRVADRFMIVAVGGWVGWMLVVQHPAVVPSPDLPWSVLLLLSVWAWLLERDEGSHRPVGMLPLLLASSAAALRFNALPAAGCAWIFYVFSGPRPFARALRGAVIVGLFVLPEIAASFRTSGCPLFPTTVACVDRSWGLGAQHAREYAAFVRWFARANEGRLLTLPPTRDASGWAWWLPTWLSQHVFVLAASFVTLAIAIAPTRWTRPFRLLAWAAVACVAVTFVVAPANRFLVPYLLCAPCALLANQRWPGIEPFRARRALALAVTTAALLIVLVARSGFHPRGIISATIPFSERHLSRDLVIPEPIKQPDSLRVRRSGSLTYYTTAQLPDTGDAISWQNPMDARCWGAPLPCTPHLAAPGVTLASPTDGLRKGFVRPLSSPASER